MSTATQPHIERTGFSPSALADRLPPSYCTHTPSSSALNLAARLIDDRSTSDWLRVNIGRALNRDLVDATNDCELLLSILTARLDELNTEARK